MASDSFRGFSHPWPGVFHISLRIRKTQPRGWKKRRTNNRAWLAPSARGVSLWHFLCIRWANASVYSSENSHKATHNANFCCLVSSLPDSYLLTNLLSSAPFCWLFFTDCVSLETSNIRGSSICSPNSLYKKTSHEILGELKAAFKTGASNVPRPRPILLSLLRPICQASVNSQFSPTPPSPPRGREKKNVTKMNFSSCNVYSPKWIINDCYIFFPYLWVWVFLFLWTSFFKAQHVGPMLQGDLVHRTFVWVLRQNRQRDSLTGTHTHRNGCHP